MSRRARIIATILSNKIPIPISPNWDNIGTEYWGAWKSYINYLISANPNKTETVTLIDTEDVDAYKWMGGVLSPQGNIYSFPGRDTTILKINPTDDTFANVGAFTPDPVFGHLFGGAVLAPNGYIYAVPRNATGILKLNPADDTYELLGDFAADGYKYSSAVLAPGGIIYGIPAYATTFLKIDTNTDTITTFGEVAAGESWSGAILAPNGYIYGFPWSNGGVAGQYTILKLNPADDTFIKIGDFLAGGDYQYRGSVLAPNDYIYVIPHLETALLKFNPANDTYATLVTLDDINYFSQGVLAPNGCIYLPPSASHTTSNHNILRINTIDDSLYYFGDFPALPGTKSLGVALSTNGCVYATPFNYRYIIKIDLGLSVLPDQNFCLTSQFRSTGV